MFIYVGLALYNSFIFLAILLSIYLTYFFQHRFSHLVTLLGILNILIVIFHYYLYLILVNIARNWNVEVAGSVFHLFVIFIKLYVYRSDKCDDAIIFLVIKSLICDSSISGYYSSKTINNMNVIAWKVSVFGITLVRIFPHLDWIRMRENADQNNAEYGHFSRSMS